MKEEHRTANGLLDFYPTREQAKDHVRFVLGPIFDLKKEGLHKFWERVLDILSIEK